MTLLGKILALTQLLLAVLLIVAILLQQKGAGLGSAFGGSGSIYTTRRGVDKLLFQITIVISALFFAVSLAYFII
ncbi:MAG: preprotein translocase subunit SecG [Patescibacteria group bacterium]